jgi:hypothetical protein
VALGGGKGGRAYLVAVVSKYVIGDSQVLYR